MARARKAAKPAPEVVAFERGLDLLRERHELGHLLRSAHVLRAGPQHLPGGGWAVGDVHGRILANVSRRGDPEEWAFVLGHCLLHLAFGHHFGPDGRGGADRGFAAEAWNTACDLAVHAFLLELRLGRPPLEIAAPDLPRKVDERELYEDFLLRGVIPERWRATGTAGRSLDLLDRAPKPDPKTKASGWRYYRIPDWPLLFGRGLARAVTSALEVAAGHFDSMDDPRPVRTRAEIARQWFMASYPLLGSLAAGFDIVEDAAVCRVHGVEIAAIDPGQRRIYINAARELTDQELRFVVAHELLHVGLSHGPRTRGRDPFLWNVACDYVINLWLVEMGIGAMPDRGLLFDAGLQGLSAEEIYDRLVRDIRRNRKLVTLAGKGVGDILAGDDGFWTTRPGLELDEFCRRALGMGLEYHRMTRGLLPAGLVEEIRSLLLPPIPWDVALAYWFDEHFPPLERRRTYGRQNRRQAATPDIPRPAWYVPDELRRRRTFGVILDTSGSMANETLGKALGAIASYSEAKEVAAVRLVYCDAMPYDQGYVAPRDLLGRVEVAGRGGTVLQPAVDLLAQAADFPPDGPVLVITDGWTDVLRIQREHAFLMPAGARLPFTARGPVFAID